MFDWLFRETFRNGQSIYGTPVREGQGEGEAAPARVVDLARTRHLHIRYGERLLFRSETGAQFGWTFDGLDNRAVPVKKIAPPGFPDTRAVVHIGRSPANRGGD